MNRSEVLELVDSATMQAIKTLTSKRALMKTKYFEIGNVPRRLSIQKILSYVRLNGNLNFIFFIQKRLMEEESESCSWIFGCRNSVEFNNFLWQFKEFTIDGIKLFVKAAKKELEVRYGLLMNPNVQTKLKLVKLNSSPAYNKHFPSERMMEILIEADTNNVLDLLDGILLNYKHSTRSLNDEIFISTYNRNEVPLLQSSLASMGNSDVSIMQGTLFLLEKSIWARQLSWGRDDMIQRIDPCLLDKNIITNLLDINSIRNSLI
jgi:hypothetical protein